MTLAYLGAVLAALVVYVLMAGFDMRLRVGISVGVFVCLAAVATWYVLRVGDAARPGSVEVTPGELDKVAPVSKPPP